MEESLPNVSDLEDQLAAQQNMIEQMRDTLLQREQVVTTNEKKVQDYAATLSRIRSSHRPGNKKKDDASKSSMALDVTPEKGPSSKMSLLRKQMEENRAILEQRGKLINEHKQSVEGMVEKLSAQLSEKDMALEELRRSRQTQESLPIINPSSEESRELYSQVIARDNKIIELNNKILQLERSIMDYEESLREKESVLEARTRAVVLLQEDLGVKHASALQHLEEARTEAANLKAALAEKEKQLKAEKQNLLDTIAAKEQKLTQLETVRFDLCTRNADLQHKIVALQSKSHEVLSQGLPQDKDTIQELENKLLDLETSKADEISALQKKLEESTKLLAKTKVAYSKRIKTYEQKLQQAQPNLQEMEQKVAMLEEEKGNLQLMLVDFEEMKALENQLQEKLRMLESEVEMQRTQIEVKTSEVGDLQDSNSKTLTELQQLRASEAELQAELEAAKNMVQESECAAVRANMKTVELEERLEHAEKAYQQLSTEVESLVAQKAASDESENLQDVLDGAEKDRDALRSELENLKAQLSAQETLAREASEALAHAQQTLSLKSTEHEAEVESLRAQISAKEERVSLLEERISCLSDESQKNLDMLSVSMQEAAQAQQALSNAESVVSMEESRLSDAEHKIHSLEKQIAELKGALEQANQVGRDEAQARSHAQAELRELRTQLESNAVQLESASEAVAALEQLKSEHSKLTKRYHEDIASWKSKCESAEDEASATNSDLEHRNREHHAAVERLNGELGALREQMSNLEEANNELHERIEGLGLDKERLESELWNAQEELAAAKELQTKTNEELQQQTELEKENLLQEIQFDKAKIYELEQHVAVVKEEAQQYLLTSQRIEGEFVKLQESKSMSDAACDDLKTKLKSIEENFEQMRSESEKLKALNGELSSQLHSNQSLESNVQGLTGQLMSMNEELNQLKWVLGEKDLTLQSLAQQIQSYEDQNTQLNANVKHLETLLAESNRQKQQLVAESENIQASISHFHSQASAKDAATNYQISELEKVNASLQATLEQQKLSFEQNSSKLVAEVERLNQQLIEAQSASKVAVIPDEISWGEEPSWQEQQTVVDNSSALLVEALQKQLKEAEASQAKLAEDLRTSQVRCGKALKQLKTLKEQKQQPAPPSDLGRVMEEELQSQVATLQKELDEVKTDRNSLLAKAETLKDANTRLTESKKQLDLEIERLKVERLALEEEAADWGQDDRIEALEKRLHEAYDRCKELEDQLIGDDETEAESMLLQEGLIKARERCAELEKLRVDDEERLRQLENQLAVSLEQLESLKNTLPTIEDSEVVTRVVVPTVEASRPTSEEAETMTEEVGLVEASVNTDQPPAESTSPKIPPASVISEAAAYEAAKVRATLAQREQEVEGLTSMVSQLRSTLDAKSQELALRSTDPELRSELDSALYLLHQRDVRCDELTLELMALMEERDALQLRLSSALRLAAQADQLKEAEKPGAEDLQLKLSELHSVGHKRDVTLRGEQEMRNTEQRAALLTPPHLHFTPNQRVLQIEDPPQQEGSSGLLGWLWGY